MSLFGLKIAFLDLKMAFLGLKMAFLGLKMAKMPFLPVHQFSLYVLCVYVAFPPCV